MWAQVRKAEPHGSIRSSYRLLSLASPLIAPVIGSELSHRESCMSDNKSNHHGSIGWHRCGIGWEPS